MTIIEVIEENNYIKYISIKGHADYDVIGKDIVCAAISTATQLTSRAICDIDKDSIKYEEEESSIIISVLKYKETVHLLLNTMLKYLREIQEQYPLNLKIIE